MMVVVTMLMTMHMIPKLAYKPLLRPVLRQRVAITTQVVLHRGW